MNFELEANNFSLKDTLTCGQCFRFRAVDSNSFLVFAGKNSAVISQKKSALKFKFSTCGPDFWENYLDLNYDYGRLLNNFRGDKILEKAMYLCGGIKILRQDPWETLVSFIISANNNIPRIQGIIDRLCCGFGEKIENGFSFPSTARLENCSSDDLAVLRAGFRARYILDAASKVSSGEVDLTEIYDMDVEDAKKSLMKICGVGDKVAKCVLLFGYHKMDAFPVDVWMKKVLQEHYPNGPSEQISSCPGLAQQILFHAKRNKYI